MTTPTKLEESFFKKDAETAAKAILGAYLVRQFPQGNKLVGRVQEVAAYEGETKTSSIGMLYPPGTIGVSTKFGKNLIDIATEREGKSSCITLIAANFDWGTHQELIQGPGNLSRTLGIDRSYDGISIKGNDFWIEFRERNKLFIKKRSKTGSANLIGYFYF